jgi:GTP diphosphokinase / guanosine-3',5'-bis(diphosphate) 3'-diphosphatase
MIEKILQITTSTPAEPKVEDFLPELQKIFKQLPRSLKDSDRALIEKSFYFAFEAHKGRKRYSKEPYFIHCLEVAKILADLQLDALAIAGGFLHDVVEDTNIPLADLQREFGNEIANMVDGVTKISGLHFESFEVRQAANFRKMLLSMSKDIRVILIKFADRLHNMRTIEHLPSANQLRIAHETLEVYAPLAHRFGIARIKSELEDLSFKVIDYEAYREIASLVTLKKEERAKLIQEAITPITAELKKFGVNAKIEGRAKHLYSIYHKIRTRGKSFDEILDLLAIRIIVEKLEECYFVLGVVHSLWTPIHEKFADFIATPKSNMYQSLHTKVRGPAGRLLEVQIRTRKMHVIAEEGIAAHWRYKEGTNHADDVEKFVTWVRQFLDMQSDTATPQEFMDTLREDLFSDEAFVFTPRGEVFTLPKGATPIDFAFAVHTDIGLHCIGAKVNKKIVPLNTPLSSGDMVEIITSATQKPSQDWLRYAVSARAKSKIKRWLKESQWDQSIKLGQELLHRELNRLRLKVNEHQMDDLVKESNFSGLNDFHAALGNGDLSIQNVIGRLTSKNILPAKDTNPLQEVIRRVRRRDGGIRIQGMDDLMVNFADCCRPLPGDRIIGFITTGKGIGIHRADCKNVRKLLAEADREIHVEWDVDRNQEFNARVRLLSEDRRQLLKDITTTISALNVNIIGLEMRKEGTLALGTMVLKVKDLAHLTKVIRRIQEVKGVVSVSRFDEETDPGHQQAN